jgi:hypothetical protein
VQPLKNTSRLMISFVHLFPLWPESLVGPNDMTVARKRLGKHIPVATNTHATLEEPLDAVHVTRNTQYLLN